MAKVIQMPPKEIKCGQCKSLIEYTEQDIVKRKDLWGEDFWYVIVCPNQTCQYDIMIKDYHF
jgi:hypothetical protein